MTTDQIRTVHRAKPFKPFTVHLADGTSVDVTHPENMFQSQGGRTIIVNTRGEKMEIIDLLLVTKITTHQDEPPSRRRK
jgi:hypothetical protein